LPVDVEIEQEADIASELMEKARKAVRQKEWHHADIELQQLLASIQRLRIRLRDKRLPMIPPCTPH